MSTRVISGFNDEGKFKSVDNILYLVDTSNTYKGHLINSTPFDELMFEEYKQEEYIYMYEKCNINKDLSCNEINNDKKQLNKVYTTLDMNEHFKPCLKYKKNKKEHNWKKHCKQIKKKQQQKIKSKMIKKKQMYKFDLNYNNSYYDLSWYHLYKKNFNCLLEIYYNNSCDNDCDNYSNLTFLDDDYSHLFQYEYDSADSEYGDYFEQFDYYYPAYGWDQNGW